MFKIEGHTISLTRGDKCTITLKVSPKKNNEEESDYIFKPSDIVSFAVYNKKGLNNEPLLKKEIVIVAETNIVDICLSSQDTKIGEMSNKPIEYWYEIQLNYSQTIIGYDESGPKVLILYPEGADLK